MFTSNENIQSSSHNQFNVGTHQKNEVGYYAQPYSLDAQGFYFSSFEEYQEKVETLRDCFGNPVEEFEIQFVDGSAEDSALFEAFNINQCNLEAFLEMIEELNDHEKAQVFYLGSNHGISLEDAFRSHEDVCITEQDANEYGYELFFEIYGHDIPESLHSYIDTDAFTHDMELNGELCSFDFGGLNYLCTNANGF